MGEGDYFTSTTSVEEKTEYTVEERNVREEDVWRTPETPSPQTMTVREDDWSVLLSVVPRQSSYVPPGIPKIPCAADFQNHSRFFVLSHHWLEMHATFFKFAFYSYFVRFSYVETKRPNGSRKFCP